MRRDGVAWLGLLLGVGGLAACSDEGVKPTVTVTAADTADQVLTRMEHLITTDGVRRTRVLADTAYIYEPTQLARLKQVTVTFFDANGLERSTVTADSGLYQMRDGSMTAWEHVVGKTPDGKRLTSNELRYDARSREISSTKPFVFDRPGQHLEGNGFVSDPDFANVRAQQPRAHQLPGQDGAPAGGGIRLPGQD
ncbi:MAG: LPS export ABC transporter periplasmic protein LptC [Gemmatimonadetes bacterium]|nr:LPS export ABC transporter periplasmic protein LptC [Gemmatimonadota bacterium]MBK7924260.1 LPS export ABC transporter periplasmic protein LptC [Gemmatimonadota bacterium]MBK9691494.1 LPS export ABC transporter periplasmic protein LptC [Gemmatimonadota bacterium]